MGRKETRLPPTSLTQVPGGVSEASAKPGHRGRTGLGVDAELGLTQGLWEPGQVQQRWGTQEMCLEPWDGSSRDAVTLT